MRAAIPFLMLCLFACPALGDDASARRGADMDYGPFLTGSLDLDPKVSEQQLGESTEQTGDNPNNLASKAVIVRLRAGDVEAAVAFDTDLLRYAAGWTGGFVNLRKTHMTSEKGSVPLTPDGKLAFTTPLRTPGWAIGETRSFKDPRERPFGPLPKSVGQYKGLYRHGDQVIFRYSVGGTDVLDMPGLTLAYDAIAFTRTLRIAAGDEPVSLLVAEKGARVSVKETANVKLATRDGRVFIDLPNPRPFRTLVKFSIAPQHRVAVSAAFSAAGATPPEDLDRLIRGGPPRWTKEIIAEARPARSSEKPYVIDELTLPSDNPWKSWIRPTGFDFFQDGTRAALCTWNGDVWIVSGIGSNPEKLTWRRFAAGLYEPLGLRVVDGVIYATCRDQIVRLHDLNRDSEADFYECFNNDGVVSANYHGFAMDLERDAAGNFYYVRCGQKMSPQLPAQGSLIRVSKDGSTSAPVAAGLRAANGIGIGPRGEITAADNQGVWMPACRINLVKPGGFYGFLPHVRAAGGPDRKDFDPPICWLPMSVDSSSGSQTWVPENEKRWGPFAGQMLHTSYGRSSLMLVMLDEVEGVTQGGVVRFPLSFASGVMRARFNPRDGQLYLCGLKAWQSSAAQDGTFCRVRYTGKPVAMPCALRVVPNGIELTFTHPVDPELANDPDSFGVEQWNYRWTEQYGSPEFSAADPKQQRRDEVEVKSAKLREDGKTVVLEIPDLKPVMQMSIRYDLDTRDGQAMTDTMYLTINGVPKVAGKVR